MRNDRSEQRKYWDALARIDPNAAIIDPNDIRGSKNSYLAGIRDKAFQESLNRYDIQSGTLLDIGCGTGSATYPLLLAGHHIVGIDISLELLRHAKKRCGGSNCLFVTTDGQGIPVSPDSFDAAIIYVVLSYLVDDSAVRRLLSDIRSALKPTAPLILIEQARTRRTISEEGRKVQRTPLEWERLLESADFKIRRSTILRHGRFPTTPLIRSGLIPRMFWPATRRLERKFAARFGLFNWDYAEIRFEALA